MEELVWRKQGEERCDWTPKQSTEKKALRAINEGPVSTGPVSTGGAAGTGREYTQIGGVACGAASACGAAGAGVEYPPNKREAANTKINERYLVGQATQNPFMPNNNYVNDLENQINFLTPQKNI